MRGVPGQRRSDQRHERRGHAGQVGAARDDAVEDRLVGAAAEPGLTPTVTYAGSPFPATEAGAGAETRAPGDSPAPRPSFTPSAAPGPAAPGPAVPYTPRAPKQAARDVADLLPPVNYAEARPRRSARQQPAGPRGPDPAAGYRDQAGPWGPAGPRPAPPAAPVVPAPPGTPGVPEPRPQARSTTMAGAALMVAAVALTVMLPVAGLLASLAVITLLRAADLAQSKLAVRRSVYGPRASDLLVVLVTAPLAVVRALLTEVLMAPLAAVVAAVAYGLTVVLTHSMNMPRAGAYAAAAAVAWYGLGPGSGRPRRQLNRMAGAVARTRSAAAVIALAVWGLAVAAVLFASSQTPYYWPAVDPHLPSLQNLITSASHWLLRNVHA